MSVVSKTVFFVLVFKFNFEFNLTRPTSDKSYLSFLKYRLLNTSSAISIDGVNHEREAIWSMEDNQGSNNDIQLRAGNQSQFNGAFEVENLGFSSSTKNFTGGPYSGNNLNTSVLNGSSNTYFARMDGVQRLSGTDYTTDVDGRKLKLWLFSNRTGKKQRHYFF